MRGRVWEVVIYFKFHENRSMGLRDVEGRKSPSPIDLAHGLYDSLYYRTSRDNKAHLIQGAVKPKVTRRRSHQQNKCVFSARQNCPRERSGCRSSAGRLFHGCCPATAKAGSTGRVVVRCGTHVWTLEDRSCRRLEAMCSFMSP